MADAVDKIWNAICLWKRTHYGRNVEPRFIYVGGDLLNLIKRDVFRKGGIAQFVTKGDKDKDRPELQLWGIPVRVVVDDPEHLEVL